MNCGKALCNVPLTDKDSFIKCAGFCEKVFHGSCVNLNRNALSLLNSNNNVIWFCNKCVVIQQSGLQNLLKLNDEIKKLKSDNELTIVANYKLIQEAFDERFDRLEEKILKLNKNESCCKDTFSEIIKKSDNNKEVFGKRFDNLEKIILEPNKKDSCCQEAVTQILKKSDTNNKKIMDPVLIIKPKDKNQTIEKTKIDLRSKVKADEIKSNGLINASEGGIIVRCKNTEDLEKAKELLEEKMSEEYDVKIPNRKNPRLKIVNVEDCPESLEKIKEILLKQNDDIFVNESEVKIIARLNVTRNRKAKYYSIVIETTGSLYNSIMSKESPTVNFGWSKCRIFDAIHIRRCFNCCSYSHLKEDCDAEIVCFKCAGQHKSADCNVEEEKCINCTNSNKTLHKDIDVKHNALSFECPVYQRILKLRKRNISYE